MVEIKFTTITVSIINVKTSHIVYEKHDEYLIFFKYQSFPTGR